jgi:CheY-like chemotaxis protein
MMPRKNGYEVCDEIKNNPKYQDITVILLTAVGSAVTTTSYSHQDGMSTLADDYIPKPIDLDKLMSMIGDYLS